jgi:hypothetical protein
MQLIELKYLRDRMLLEDRSEINDVLKSSLAGAIPWLETVLQTSFDKGTASDLFSIPTGTEKVLGFYHLKLTKGFVRGSPAPVVATGYDLSSVSGDLYPSCIMDAERGFLYVPEASDLGCIRVSYDYGFQTPSEVPTWLRELALCYTIKVLSMHQINDRKEELSKVYSFVDQHSTTIADSRLRMSVSAISAIGA